MKRFIPLNLIRQFLLIGIYLLTSGAIVAQNNIKGTVSDDLTNEPLIGANVVIKGTTIGTTTDINGDFSLTTELPLPITISISYLGYTTTDFKVTSFNQKVKYRVEQEDLEIEGVEVVDSRITEKQKESPVTVESMDIIAVKETPAANFYDGLGNLKGVDITAASMGFKVINTRGFNSTRPVRSLQIVDGVDNQAPGLNFSVGNFAGVSELDVQRVELIVGANSALYGPNAFNGVISMETKDPFLHKGISAMGKVGERNLREMAVRYANSHKLFGDRENFAYKLNISYMEADDWEADNYAPTDQSQVDADNPGGFDAVNIYGDENLRPDINNFLTPNGRLNRPGLGVFHRTGYREVDLVDYDTKNLKISPSLHYKFKNDIRVKYTFNYGTGTTVYQGDNRYSLKNLQIQQHVGEVSKKDKFFIRAYHTAEDAGDSYDAVFTALLLQEAAKSNADWSKDYENYWIRNNVSRVNGLDGYPDPNNPAFTGLWFNDNTRDSIYGLADEVIAFNMDSLIKWHNLTREFADGVGGTSINDSMFMPGTARFDSAFNSITSKNTFLEGGSGFFDQSSLTHYQAQYKFNEDEFGLDGFSFLLGSSFRMYRPKSNGTIFLDTGNTVITNSEYGIYGSLEQKLFDKRLILTATGRVDKNENFDHLFSPAASAVYLYNDKLTFRTSFSSAIRNPTLQDQYLYYNVGRAILIGNLNGFDSLVTVPSFFNAYQGTSFERDSLEYFNVDPVRPERVRSFEVGFKGVLWKNVFLDVSYYFSWYTDFLGFKIGADIEIDTLNFATVNDVFRVTANSPDQITTQGVSLGLVYYFKKYYALSGNYSFNELDRRGSTDPIIPAFNTPANKYNLGISGRDIVAKIGGVRIKNVGFNVNYKWVQGFLFEGSPQFTGEIPDYDMIDAQVNYRAPKLHTTFKLGASNLLNKMNFQTYGGPRIGRMTYFSVLYELDKG